MTSLDAAALALFGSHDRRFLNALLRACMGRSSAEDLEVLPPRLPFEPVPLWACRCRRPGDDPDVLRAAASRLVEDAERQLRRAAQLAILPVPLGDDRYPPLLSAIPDPPAMLWIQGDPAHLLRPAVAIVGSRAATSYGLEVASRLARDLAAAGLVVVSGLARGIDSAAHSGTLAAGGSTVAILGSGPDRIYPSEHAELARNIQSAGVVASEFPPGVPPLQHHFPLRNRIISGLSHAVVVVEAPEKSGALITASAAAEQGREVFVVPGQVTGARNRGGHLLIRDGAKLAESADDILQDVGRPVSSRGTGQLEFEMGQLPEVADFTVDEVASRTGDSPSVVLARLLELELSGQIQRIGGGRFVRSSGRVLP